MAEQPLISIVDDDRSSRDAIRRLLKSLGYPVAVFASAAEFLASAELAATACLVADIQMPAMTGIELYTRLLESGHPIPTILVTAYPDDSLQQRASTLGVEHYLYKPLEEADLIGRLRSVLAHGKASQRSST